MSFYSRIDKFNIWVGCCMIQYLIVMPIGTHYTLHNYIKTLNLDGITVDSMDDTVNEICAYGFENTIKYCNNATYYANNMCAVTVDSNTGSCTDYETYTDKIYMIDKNTLIIMCVIIIPSISLLFVRIIEQMFHSTQHNVINVSTHNKMLPSDELPI